MKYSRIVIVIMFLCCVALAATACDPKSCRGEEDTSGETVASSENDEESVEDMYDKIYLTIGVRKIDVKLERNSATAALTEILKQGDIVYVARDYGGFEKVGNLGYSLPRSDRQTTTTAGDVILYSGNQIVLFYGSNSWSYTKLGRVQGISDEEWKELLTRSNDITVTIGLS